MRTATDTTRGFWQVALLAVIGLWLACGAGAAPARAEAIGVSYGVLVDPTRQMTLADMQSATFDPMVSTFGGGFTKSAYWLRVSFDQPDPPPLKLRFRPTAIDQIQLFAQQPDGHWKRSDSGEMTVPTPDTSMKFGWFSFALDPPPGHQVYYVRIVTASPGAITVVAIASDSVLRGTVRTAAYVASVFALQFFAVLLVLKRLDPLQSLSHASFATMICVFSTYLFWFNGFAQVAFPTNNRRVDQFAYEFLGMLAIFNLVAFHYLFLRDFGLPRLLRRLGIGLLMLCAIGVIVGVTAPGLTLRIAVVCYLALLPMLVAIVVFMRHDGPITRRQVRFVYGVYCLVLLTNMTLRFGLLDLEILYRYSVDAIGVVTATLILTLIGLQHRNRQQRQFAREVELARISTDLDIARTYRTMQRGLVREIDTLARRLFAQTRTAFAANGQGATAAKADRSVSALRDVIERCLFAQEAERGHWAIRVEPFSPAQAIADMTATLAPPDRWHLTLDPFDITTDRVLFDLALRNVLSNALRCGAATAPVDVALRKERRGGQSGTLLSVTNVCPVAHPFDAARVFAKFYRGPSSRAASGTGLGLFITREALAALAGTITLSASDAVPPEVTAQIWIPDR